jgi:CRP/FNR family transcriptional regulator, cyclic AMP receptor protein
VPALAPSLDALPDTLRALAARGQWRRLRTGQLLIEEGAHDDLLYLIVAGRLRAFSRDDREREITYGSYGAGDYVGEMSLDGGPRSANVVAETPGWCVAVTRQALREHIAEHPDFAFELIARVIRRARLATRTARNLALLDVYRRIVLLLDELSVAQPDGTRRIDGRPTHAEIASRTGCSREMVSRILKDLERGGYVGVEPNAFVLHRALPARW